MASEIAIIKVPAPIVTLQQFAELEGVSERTAYGTRLPDVVRRLHTRVGCVSAGHCLQRLPESELLPDAGKRPGYSWRHECRCSQA